MKRRIAAMCISAVIAISALGASWTVHAEDAVEEAVEEGTEEDNEQPSGETAEPEPALEQTAEPAVEETAQQAAEAAADPTAEAAADQTTGAAADQAAQGDPNAALSSTVDPLEEQLDRDITIWCPKEIQDIVASRVGDFLNSAPEYAEYKVIVKAVSEEDAAANMAANPNNEADLYYFTQDQLTTLVISGALTPVGDSVGWIREQNDEGSVFAASYADSIYAYPVADDSGYVLYYDTTYIKDVSTLDGILADCEELKKNFYMDIESAPGQAMFFFGTGCDANYERNKAGNFVAANVTYASPEGVKALKAMIVMLQSPAFKNGSDPSETEKCVAIISDTGSKDKAKELFGDSFACSKLPTFYIDDADYQMSGYSSYHFLGIKPQSDPDKQTVLRLMAQDLTGEEVQLACYESVGWCPSNKFSQYNESVLEDLTTTAFTKQVIYTLPLGQYPNGYWLLTKELGDKILSGSFEESSDSQLLTVLKGFQDSCLSYVP